jgi:hypothetical protein
LISPGESFTPDAISAMQRSVDQLIEIVDRYDLRANGDLVYALESLRKRTATHQLTLAVFSDSRESKTSLIHALLNITLENAWIPPSTVACTYLSYGLRAECAVTLANSMTAWLPLEQLAAFVSEKTPGSNLKKVSVRLPNAALENGLVVIDTPELTGDPEALLSCTATAVLEADACIFVLKAGEELKENVIAFLQRMQGKLEKFFFVLESAPGLSGIERERSLNLIRHSLEQRCGLSRPQVTLLSSLSPEGSEAALPKQRSEACQEKLLGFARVSWQSSTSNEVAKAAGETLTQADGALNLRELTPLQRMRLRRVVKVLDGISQQSAGLALASDTAMRTLVEPPAERAPDESNPPVEFAPAPRAAAPESATPESATPESAADETAPPQTAAGETAADAPAVTEEEESPADPWQRAWEPTFTTHVSGGMPSFPGKSFSTWVAAPPATPIPAGPRRVVPRIVPVEEPVEEPVTETMTEPVTEKVTEPATSPAASPNGRDSRRAESAPEPAPRTVQWRGERYAWGEDADDLDYAEDEDLFTRSDRGHPVWRVAGFAGGLVAVLAIGWALFVNGRPYVGRLLTRHAATAQLNEAPVQPTGSAPVPPIPARPANTQPVPSQAVPSQPVPSQPVPSQTGSNQSNGSDDLNHPDDAASRQGISTPPPVPPQSKEAITPEPAQPLVAEPHAGSVTGHPIQDVALEGALDRWIEASRSGNIPAQVACYAPVVGTYFNSRNVTRQQVQLEKERSSAGTAGVQNYRITTIGISTQAQDQRTVLLQKDWDTPTGRGPGFASSEFERLVFAQVEGQWKIVGEEEVKLLKLHRTRVSHQVAWNF